MHYSTRQLRHVGQVPFQNGFNVGQTTTLQDAGYKPHRWCINDVPNVFGTVSFTGAGLSATCVSSTPGLLESVVLGACCSSERV